MLHRVPGSEGVGNHRRCSKSVCTCTPMHALFIFNPFCKRTKHYKAGLSKAGAIVETQASYNKRKQDQKSPKPKIKLNVC